MATNFKLKRSSVANKRPGLTNLELGELALNTYDGYLFAERNGLGITTVTNLTPWFENYGAQSVVYTNSVGIGTTDPIHKLDLRGSLGGIDISSLLMLESQKLSQSKLLLRQQSTDIMDKEVV